MSINGVSTNSYPIAYTNTNAPKSTETASFADTIAEKAETAKIDWEELAFEHAGPNAPQSVKDAWMETAKETGANGLGYTSNGIFVTEMHVQEFLKWYWGGKKAEFPDVLGSSVESAIRAAQQALYSFDHPLEPNKAMSMEEQQYHMKERQFYVLFLEKLEKLQSEQFDGSMTMNTKYKSEIGEHYLQSFNRRNAAAVSADDTFPERTKIENAWNKTLKDTGIDPFPMNRISTALVIMVESGQRGLGPNFPGDTVASATSLVKRIIDRLENPLVPPQNPEYRNDELTFYRKFLENLTA